MNYRRYKITAFSLITAGLLAATAYAGEIKPVHIVNHGQIINVTTTADEDNGYLGGGMGVSLREAIAYADAGSIVILPKGRFVTGDRAATYHIESDIILKGTGIGKTVIDGNESGTVFSVARGAELNLSDLTITGGSGIRGGAIANRGTLSMYAVVLTGNRAADGGAIYSEGTAELLSCIVRDNNAGYFGGGIHNDGGRLRLTDVGLVRNTAEKGGGMYNQFGFVVMREGTIFGNVAGTGGGVTDYFGVTQVRNTSASDNYGGNFEGKVLTLGDNYDSDGTSNFRNGFAGDKVHTTASPAGLAHLHSRGERK